MASKTLNCRALARAVDILGMPEVARQLKVSQTTLEIYLQQPESLPETLFLRIVDLLAEDQMVKLSNERSRSNNGDGKRDKR